MEAVAIFQNLRYRAFRYAVVYLCMTGVMASAPQLWGQSLRYTHSELEDGFGWPFFLEETFSTETPDGVEYANFTGRDTFFDNGYSIFGATDLIDGEAWWGSTEDFGSVEFAFFNTDAGAVDSFAFDFAWWVENAVAPSTLYIQAEDSNAGFAEMEYDLNTFYAVGPYDVAEGHIFLDPEDFFYEGEEGDLTTLFDFTYLNIYLGDIGATTSANEFALDNVAINGDGGGGPPEESDLVAPLAVSTRFLRGTFSPQVSVSVDNLGTGATTFTQSLDASSDPEFQVQPPVTGVPIGAGQNNVSPSAAVGILDKEELSGTYVAQIRVANDLNPADPDDVLSYTIMLYDPPLLTDNSSAPIDVASASALSLANADVEPHAGALRSGAEVTAKTIVGERFSVAGLEVGEFVAAAETKNAEVSFNRFGQLSRLYTATAIVELKMNSAPGSFLNGSQSLSPVVWNLEYDLDDNHSDSANVAASEPFRETIGVNTSRSAVTLLDGVSGENQTISFDVVASPSATASLATDAVDLQFGMPGDQYVLQFTYTETSIPDGFSEADLDLLFFDTGTSQWRSAITANSDGGAAATRFDGSYADYLVSRGGGSALLSAYGIDQTNNHAWAVLDHASIFGFGTLLTGEPIPGDFNRDGIVDASDYVVWRDNLGANGEAAIGDAGDGQNGVDQGDYVIWRSSFSPTALSANSTALYRQTTLALPEPTSIVLCLVACLILPRSIGSTPRH